MNNSKLLLGFLAGAAVGGVMGILFAPDKGEETRKKIAKAGTDLSDAAKDKLDEVVTGIKDKFSSVRKGMEDVEEKGLAGYRKAREQA